MELGYWSNIRGRATTIRYILAHSKAEWSMHDYESATGFSEWHGGDKIEMAKTNPLANLPWLKLENGTNISQTSAIIKYLCRRFGYAGENDDEKIKIDMINVHAEDLTKASFENVCLLEKGEAKDKFANTKLPTMLAPLNSWLELHKTKFFCSDKVTEADFNLVNTMDLFSSWKTTVFENLPHLQKWFETMKAEMGDRYEIEHARYITFQYQDELAKAPEEIKQHPIFKEMAGNLPRLYWGVPGLIEPEYT